MVWEAYLVSGFVGSWWLQKPDIRSRPKTGSRALKMSRSGNGLGSLSSPSIYMGRWLILGLLWNLHGDYMVFARGD